jgi:hypothetical protein
MRKNGPNVNSAPSDTNPLGEYVFYGLSVVRIGCTGSADLAVRASCPWCAPPFPRPAYLVCWLAAFSPSVLVACAASFLRT